MCVQDSKAVMVLLDIKEGVSRVHAARRFFELLRFYDIDLPVIHTRRFAAGTPRAYKQLSPMQSGSPRWSFLIEMFACIYTHMLRISNCEYFSSSKGCC